MILESLIGLMTLALAWVIRHAKLVKEKVDLVEQALEKLIDIAEEAEDYLDDEEEPEE